MHGVHKYYLEVSLEAEGMSAEVGFMFHAHPSVSLFQTNSIIGRAIRNDVDQVLP
jgi:hypothetical protein